MDNEFETEKPFIVTTADMLEIVAGGGNGVEYVDITGLMETAAKELKEKDAKIERLQGALQPFAKVLKGNWSHQSNEMLMSFGFGEDKRLELTLGDFRNASAALKEKE